MVSIGGVIILTRGMGERLINVRDYCVVLVERLGGLFFAGRRSFSEDSFPHLNRLVQASQNQHTTVLTTVYVLSGSCKAVYVRERSDTAVLTTV